jgi:hypothetical protein
MPDKLSSPDRDNRESFELSKRLTIESVYTSLGLEPKRDTTTQEDAQEAKDVRLIKNSTKEEFFCQEKLREFGYFNQYQDFTMELEGVIGAKWGTYCDLDPRETKYFFWATGNDDGTPDLKEAWLFEAETLFNKINEIAGNDIINYRSKDLTLLHPDYLKHLAEYTSKIGDYDISNNHARKQYLSAGVYKTMILNAEKHFRSKYIKTNGRARIGGSCAFPASFVIIPIKDIGDSAIFHQKYF